MTIDQLNKLPDEEVRVRVGSALGWGNMKRKYKGNALFYEGIPNGSSLMRDLPNYPADLNAAFTLVEKLKEDRWTPNMFRPGKQWLVTFQRVTMGDDFDVTERSRISGNDPSLARAICLAFLLCQEK